MNETNSDKITFNFIWDNKIAKIKNNTIIGEREKGGLSMIDFTLMNKALKCIWIKRFSLNKNSAWTVIPNEATSHLGGFTFLTTCNCKRNDISIKELPLFCEKTLQYWFEFKEVQSNTKPCTKKQRKRFYYMSTEIYLKWKLSNKNGLSKTRNNLIGHTIFLTSEKYRMTNHKTAYEIFH